MEKKKASKKDKQLQKLDDFAKKSSDLTDLSQRQLAGMLKKDFTNTSYHSTCTDIVSRLFSIAEERMESEHDKTVL